MFIHLQWKGADFRMRLRDPEMQSFLHAGHLLPVAGASLVLDPPECDVAVSTHWGSFLRMSLQ